MERRRESVEHPFGAIKQWMVRALSRRDGLGNDLGEFMLASIFHLGRITTRIRANLHRLS